MFGYNDIGKKIKTLAKAIFFVGAILDIGVGAFLITLGITDDFALYIILGLITILLAPILTWISTWLLYGYGELIDKTCAIEHNTRNSEEHLPTPQICKNS